MSTATPTARATNSLAESMSSLSADERAELLAVLTDDQARALLHDWAFWARPTQLPPPGNWRIWLVMAGRGFGKSRAGAEWVRASVSHFRYVNIVGPTADDARDIMVEGESGILAVCPDDERPVYVPSKRRLEWPNGARSLIFTADEPDRLRGKQHSRLWGDELAAWRYPESYDQAMFGLRLGNDPRGVFTTTPKPVNAVKDLLDQARDGTGTVVVTGGSSYDNIGNLAPAFFSQIIRKYEGTRLGRQELNAELLEDVEGALWSLAIIERFRLRRLPEGVETERVVVGIDPPARSTGAECGIVVDARGTDKRGYTLADYSRQGTPNEWATAAIAAYDKHLADAVVIEVNQGGDMATNTLRTIRPNLPIVAVHASRGKQTRAQPISALYERGMWSHIGYFPVLEDQMCFVAGTMVSTLTGERPIEAIRVGDAVWTRDGIRTVVASGMTQERANVRRVDTSNGRHLVATMGHPVYTKQRGFVPMGELRIGDELEAFPWGCERPALTGQPGGWANTAHRLSGAVVSGALTTAATIAMRVASCFTMPSGKRRTVPSLAASKYITETRTAPITMSATSKHLPALSIPSAMRRAGLLPGPQRSVAKAANSIGQSSNRLSTFARTVARPSLAHAPVPDGARESAAVRVAEISPLTEPVPVYNLTVAGTPEYYANGVLVHNCQWVPGDESPDRMDAHVWAATDLMPTEEDRRATSISYIGDDRRRDDEDDEERW